MRGGVVCREVSVSIEAASNAIGNSRGDVDRMPHISRYKHIPPATNASVYKAHQSATNSLRTSPKLRYCLPSIIRRGDIDRRPAEPCLKKLNLDAPKI